MGLSFPKQVERSRVRVRHILTLKYQDEAGRLRADLTEQRTFYSRCEAETYAESVVGTDLGRCRCYCATLATEYSRAY
jgi:hypothetical protein